MGRRERNPNIPYVPFSEKKITKQSTLSPQDQQNLFRLIQAEKYSAMMGRSFPKWNGRNITSNNRKITKGRYWQPQFIKIPSDFTVGNETFTYLNPKVKRILHKVR